MVMSTASMSKPMPATVEVVEHEAIVKALKSKYKGIIDGLNEIHTLEKEELEKEIVELKKVIEGLEDTLDSIE